MVGFALSQFTRCRFLGKVEVLSGGGAVNAWGQLATISRRVGVGCAVGGVPEQRLRVVGWFEDDILARVVWATPRQDLALPVVVGEAMYPKRVVLIRPTENVLDAHARAIGQV